MLVDHHSDQGYDTESRSDFSVFSAGQLLQDTTPPARGGRSLDHHQYTDADDERSVHSLPVEFHCLEVPPSDLQGSSARKDSYTSPLKRYQEQLDQKNIDYPHAGIDKAHLDSFVDEEFEQICRPSASLINQALSDQLIIPDFGSFSTTIRELYQECKSITTGAVSDHIHQLARVPGDKWAVSICTVDGQRVSFGHHHHIFSLQSLRDVLVYALAISECGEETVHGYVGKEPLGGDDNTLVLDRDDKPHNAMIEPGGLTVLSLLKPKYSLPDRFDYLMENIQRLAAFEGVDFSNAHYLSEKMAADEIHAIAYYLMAHDVFPPNTNVKQTIDLFLQTAVATYSSSPTALRYPMYYRLCRYYGCNTG
eukprot:sb/3465933/